MPTFSMVRPYENRMIVPTRRRTLLTTPRFSVEHRAYALPEGGEATREVVVHPGAVVILPILDDGRVVMIRNFRYTVERELLELPAGTREPGEEAVQTAHRELEEETGYRAKRMEPLVAFFPSPGILTERMEVFVARDLLATRQNPEASERITVAALELAEARRLLVRGALEDGKTIAALGMFLLRAAG